MRLLLFGMAAAADVEKEGPNSSYAMKEKVGKRKTTFSAQKNFYRPRNAVLAVARTQKK